VSLESLEENAGQLGMYVVTMGVQSSKYVVHCQRLEHGTGSQINKHQIQMLKVCHQRPVYESSEMLS
jgi:hypothetical protein